jgi:2-methylisocitrate lyase-like PEP mutase family enzyme
VVKAGAKALATGSHPVAEAHGWPDGQQVPIEFALTNAKRIVDAVELPVTIDFESAYSVDPGLAAANVARLAATGAVGCNFEDQVIGGEGLHPLKEQAKRIVAIREAVGDAFFINARTDLFLKTTVYDAALIGQVIERGKAFAVPERAASSCRACPTPSRSSASWKRAATAERDRLPGAPTRKPGQRRVARISHGRSRTAR